MGKCSKICYDYLFVWTNILNIFPNILNIFPIFQKFTNFESKKSYPELMLSLFRFVPDNWQFHKKSTFPKFQSDDVKKNS